MKSQQTSIDYDANWLNGIAYEVAFWNNVYRWKRTFTGMMNWSHYGSAICLEAFDANSFLTAAADKPLVLDVGCGMSYQTGSLLKTDGGTQPLDIRYIDPLAHYYNEILKRSKRPMPPIDFGMLEYLSAFYEPESADLVIVQNALDHSARPMKGIVEAMRVLKVGGVLYLNHHPNEAETEQYKGFHQYNIIDDNGKLLIWNKHESLSVGDTLNGFATVETIRCENQHVVAILRKTANVPESLLEDNKDKKELCLLMMQCHKQGHSLRRLLDYKFDYWKFNTVQFFVQALPWGVKMKLKKLIKQA